MELDEKEDEMALYNLHDYDKEESKGISMGAFSNIKGLQYYQNPADDPYVTLNDVSPPLTRHQIYTTDFVSRRLRMMTHTNARN